MRVHETWALEMRLVRVMARVDKYGATMPGERPMNKTVKEIYMGSFELRTETDAIKKYEKVRGFADEVTKAGK